MWFFKKKEVKKEYKEDKDLPIPLLVKKPNFNITEDIYNTYSDNLKKHLLVLLIKNTSKNTLQNVRHAFDKHSLINK